MKAVHKIVLAAALVVGPLVATVGTFAAWWAAVYRLPAEAPKLIDMRTSASAPPYCVTLCASLADNPHGFPGHAYVVCSGGIPRDVTQAESFGYVPRRYWDQLASLVGDVHGSMVQHAADGNTRNLDRLSVLVDVDTYRRVERLSRNWDCRTFRAGVRDCVAFTDAAANLMHLATPAHAFVFPQDYIRRLKNMN